MKNYKFPLIVSLFLLGAFAAPALRAQEPVTEKKECDLTVAVRVGTTSEKEGFTRVWCDIKNTSKTKASILLSSAVKGLIFVYSVDKDGTKTMVYPDAIAKEVFLSTQIDIAPGATYTAKINVTTKLLVGNGKFVASVRQIKRDGADYLCEAFSEPFSIDTVTVTVSEP